MRGSHDLSAKDKIKQARRAQSHQLEVGARRTCILKCMFGDWSRVTPRDLVAQMRGQEGTGRLMGTGQPPKEGNVR